MQWVCAADPSPSVRDDIPGVLATLRKEIYRSVRGSVVSKKKS